MSTMPHAPANLSSSSFTLCVLNRSTLVLCLRLLARYIDTEETREKNKRREETMGAWEGKDRSRRQVKATIAHGIR